MDDDIKKRLEKLDRQRAELERRRSKIESELADADRRLDRLGKGTSVQQQAEQLEKINREFPIVSPVNIEEESDNGNPETTST